MKQTFTTLPAASWLQRLARLWRRGSVALALGFALGGVLLAGNLAVLLGGEGLRREDAAYRQPPQGLLFQRLLYQSPAPVTPYAEDGLLGSFDVLNEAAEDENRPPAPSVTITSRPRFTAVVGRRYRYQVRSDGGGVRHRLLAAPPGTTLSATGLLEWTPEAGQAGGRSHPVEVAVLGVDGQGARQTFAIIASERAHLLGTDEAGRDVGAALLLGTRWAVLPGLVAVAVSLLLGLLFGGLAGYYEGRTDAALTYLARLSETVPALLLLFLAAVIFRYNLYLVMIVLGIILFPAVARGVRTHVLTLKARHFIEAARELGLSDAEILWKEILWHNARPFLLTRVFYGFGLAVVVEVTLSYLNIGILPPTVSWGTMMLEGRSLIDAQQYWLAFFPAVATMAAAGGYYLLGRGLEKRFRIKKT